MTFGKYSAQDFVSASKDTLITKLARYKKDTANSTDGDIRDYRNAMQYAIDHYDELKPGYVPKGTQSNNEQIEREAQATRTKKFLVIGGVVLGLLVLFASSQGKKNKKRKKR